ncbi:unnamed protein product, partial [Rangifer tarandus platyrhynchus]
MTAFKGDPTRGATEITEYARPGNRSLSTLGKDLSISARHWWAGLGTPLTFIGNSFSGKAAPIFHMLCGQVVRSSAGSRKRAVRLSFTAQRRRNSPPAPRRAIPLKKAMQRNNRARTGPGKGLQGPGAGPGVSLRQGPLQPGAGGWSSSAPSLVVPPPRRGSAAVPASCRCVGAGAWPCSPPPPLDSRSVGRDRAQGPGGRRSGGLPGRARGAGPLRRACADQLPRPVPAAKEEWGRGEGMGNGEGEGGRGRGPRFFWWIRVAALPTPRPRQTHLRKPEIGGLPGTARGASCGRRGEGGDQNRGWKVRRPGR